MYTAGCHHLPVVGRDGHLVGVISDRDCRMALNSPHTKRDDWRDNKLANELLVRSVMTPAPIVVEPNTPADEAARLMLINHVGCLPVMRAETLVGIITKGNVIAGLLRKLEINYHQDEMQRYRSRYIFEDIEADETSLAFEYDVDGQDFKRAGEGSSRLRRTLTRLGIRPDIVRRLAIAS